MPISPRPFFRRFSFIRSLGLFVLALALLAALPGIAQQSAAQTQPWMDTNLSPLERAGLLLGAMTQAEKLAMVHGGSESSYVFHTDPIRSLGWEFPRST